MQKIYLIQHASNNKTAPKNADLPKYQITKCYPENLIHGRAMYCHQVKMDRLLLLEKNGFDFFNTLKKSECFVLLQAASLGGDNSYGFANSDRSTG